MYDKVFPPPGVGVNFVLHDIACSGGPMRLIPGTHLMPFQLHEMAVATESSILEHYDLHRVMVCPLKAGDALVRDLRLWHAGSANHGDSPRILPNTEYLAPWYADLTVGTEDHLAPRPSIPEEVWTRLSHDMQQASERVRAVTPLETGTTCATNAAQLFCISLLGVQCLQHWMENQHKAHNFQQDPDPVSVEAAKQRSTLVEAVACESIGISQVLERCFGLDFPRASCVLP
eukprot:3854633-Amphidinium_carterae.3